MSTGPGAPTGRPERKDSYARRLLLRWFVRYNPLYTASAALVLAGVLLVSRGLGGVESRSGELWLTAVIELYQLLLIGAAAFLYRVARQRRPAVILVILEMVYLCDVTFQTEVAGYLGATGVVASAAWLVLVLVKIYGLAWAVRLRLSASAVAVPLAAALSMAVTPHLLQLRVLDKPTASLALGWLVFAVGVAGVSLRPRISSADSLDAWGETVLRRATRATWTVWSAVFCGHVVCWAFAHGLNVVPLLAAVALVAALATRYEVRAWAAVATAFGLSYALAPTTLAPTALLAAVALALAGLRGLGSTVVVGRSPVPLAAHPYRRGSQPRETPRTAFVATRRPFVGALCSLYVACWTWGWSGGHLPQHALPAMVPAVVALLLCAWRFRMPTALVAVLGLVAHFFVQRQLAPRGPLQWGVVLLGCGFALLLLGVAVNWRLRHVADDVVTVEIDEATADGG